MIVAPTGHARGFKRLGSWIAQGLGWVLPFYPILVWARWHKGSPTGVSTLALYWPTVVSLFMLYTFGRSLFKPPTTVERLARLQNPDLSPAEIHHCVRVTQIWCVFFVLNGGLATFFAWRHAINAWTLYTGLISYGLIGLMIGVENVIRYWRFHAADAWFTRWLRKGER